MHDSRFKLRGVGPRAADTFFSDGPVVAAQLPRPPPVGRRDLWRALRRGDRLRSAADRRGPRVSRARAGAGLVHAPGQPAADSASRIASATARAWRSEVAVAMMNVSA